MRGRVSSEIGRTSGNDFACSVATRTSWTSSSPKPREGSQMDDLHEAKGLLDEFMQNQDQLAKEGFDRFLSDRADRLTPQLAEQLAELCSRALMSQDWNSARLTGNLA